MKKQYDEPRSMKRALATRVLAVAHPRDHDPRLWTAYIDAVPGRNHDEEQQRVREYGVKLDPKIASALFPFDPECFDL